MHITKQSISFGVVGLIVGAAVILGIRYFTYNPASVHYHANFAVYIDGGREAFKSPSYYEEEGGGSCSTDTEVTPLSRAHMHDNVNDVVHVEDHAVTWGNFFQNLHWTVTDKLIQTPSHLYLADATHKVTFMINGETVADITTRTIADKDRLLVDFGASDQTALQKEFNTVTSTASTYDTDKDPASCSGTMGPTMQERMTHLF